MVGVNKETGEVGFTLEHQTFHLHIDFDDEISAIKQGEWFAKELRTALRRLYQRGKRDGNNAPQKRETLGEDITHDIAED